MEGTRNLNNTIYDEIFKAIVNHSNSEIGRRYATEYAIEYGSVTRKVTWKYLVTSSFLNHRTHR